MNAETSYRCERESKRQHAANAQRFGGDSTRLPTGGTDPEIPLMGDIEDAIDQA